MVTNACASKLSRVVHRYGILRWRDAGRRVYAKSANSLSECCTIRWNWGLIYMPSNTYLEKLQSSKVIFAHDLLMIPIAWIGAYWLRFNLGNIPDYALDAALNSLVIVVFVQAIIFRIFGLYRGVWRFASIPDFLRITKAIASGVLVISILLFFYDMILSWQKENAAT